MSQLDAWKGHLNQFNVISLDMTDAVHKYGVTRMVPGLNDELLVELRSIVPQAGMRHVGVANPLTDALWDVFEAPQRKFIFFIDEWDAPYRLAKDGHDVQAAYADWLRGLFKNSSFTGTVVAGAYLTGILPIKKYAHQSVVSDFYEYTMVAPLQYAPYVGFTEDEVRGLCERHGLDLADVRRWYDGYDMRGTDGLHAVFAPYSLIRACQARSTGSYWPSTESFELLRTYIEMSFDGLQDDIVRAIGGASIPVDPNGIQNDMVSIESRDDVLTLLFHLGYLSYDSEMHAAHVPNDEMRAELARTVRKSHHPMLIALMRESSKLLDDIMAMDEVAVA